MMRVLTQWLLLAGLCLTPAAHALDAHARETMAQHREMARVHLQAADCLQSGRSESVCHAELREACRGLGIGKYCGLRHSH